MNAGEDIVFDDPFTDEHRVLIVVPVPRNEADEDIAPQGQLAVLGRRSVGKHLIHFNALTDFNDRLLVETGILVGPLILLHFIDILFTLNLRGGRDDDDLIAGYIAYRSRTARFTRTPNVSRLFHSVPTQFRGTPAEPPGANTELSSGWRRRAQKRNQGSALDHCFGEMSIYRSGSPMSSRKAHRHFLIEVAILVKGGARFDVVFFFIVGIKEAVLVGNFVDDRR